MLETLFNEKKSFQLNFAIFFLLLALISLKKVKSFFAHTSLKEGIIYLFFILCLIRVLVDIFFS